MDFFLAAILATGLFFLLYKKGVWIGNYIRELNNLGEQVEKIEDFSTAEAQETIRIYIAKLQQSRHIKYFGYLDHERKISSLSVKVQ